MEPNHPQPEEEVSDVWGMFPRLRRYSKFIMALVAVVIAWIILVMGSEPDEITGPEKLQGAILLLGALGVYTVPNLPAMRK